MQIPDFQIMMRPLLEFYADSKQHTLRETIQHLSKHFNLTEQQASETLQSGQRIFDNRVGWAHTYLKKAGLLESPRRSFYKITEIGLDVLKENPQMIDVEYLKKFPSFVEFRNFRRQRDEDLNSGASALAPESSPEEMLEYGYRQIKENLSQELLGLVKSKSPQFFEKLVIDLLLKMGYGGSQREAGESVGRSGDGGIDGIIKEDKLGLDTIYIQAKKWENPVGSKEIRNFVGSLVGKHATKGVFITTSCFTNDATNYVKNVPQKVVLIDGKKLVDLMLEYNVGVSVKYRYDTQKIDQDYFEEE